jgi:hypothetical protein
MRAAGVTVRETITDGYVRAQRSLSHWDGTLLPGEPRGRSSVYRQLVKKSEEANRREPRAKLFGRLLRRIFA